VCTYFRGLGKNPRILITSLVPLYRALDTVGTRRSLVLCVEYEFIKINYIYTPFSSASDPTAVLSDIKYGYEFGLSIVIHLNL